MPTKISCGAVHQTFCRINGQTVANNINITYENNITPKETYNLADVWNEIQDAMITVHDFGNYGTRNPNIDGLTDKQKNEYTTLEYYNDLLSRIDKTTLNGYQYIIGLDFKLNLQDGLKEYLLNADRCDICNASCQYCDGCEDFVPCCESYTPCSSYGSCSSDGDCGGVESGSCCSQTEGCWEGGACTVHGGCNGFGGCNTHTGCTPGSN